MRYALALVALFVVGCSNPSAPSSTVSLTVRATSAATTGQVILELADESGAVFVSKTLPPSGGVARFEVPDAPRIVWLRGRSEAGGRSTILTVAADTVVDFHVGCVFQPSGACI